MQNRKEVFKLSTRFTEDMFASYSEYEVDISGLPIVVKKLSKSDKKALGFFFFRKLVLSGKLEQAIYDEWYEKLPGYEHSEQSADELVTTLHQDPTEQMSLFSLPPDGNTDKV